MEKNNKGLKQPLLLLKYLLILGKELVKITSVLTKKENLRNHVTLLIYLER